MPLAAAARGNVLHVAVAQAGVTSFDVFCSDYYYQTSSAVPTAPEYYTFSARVETESDKDFSAFRVTEAGPVGTMEMVKEGSTFLYFSTYHHDRALRDIDYPPGTLVFTGSAGPIGRRSASRVYPAVSRFPAEPPAFADVRELKGVDTSQDLVVWPTHFSVPPGVDYAHVYRSVRWRRAAWCSRLIPSPNARRKADFDLARALHPDAPVHHRGVLLFPIDHPERRVRRGCSSCRVAWDAVTFAPLVHLYARVRLDGLQPRWGHRDRCGYRGLLRLPGAGGAHPALHVHDGLQR